MRALVAFLFVALVVAGTWSFAVAPERGWWMPEPASTVAPDVDRLFLAITWILGVAFVATVGLLAWTVWRGGRAAAPAVRESARVEILWTLVPGVVLVVLAFTQTSLWNRMQSARGGGEAPFARVRASQFEWRFVYPGPDGRLDTADDLERPYELVVPAGRRIVLALTSRDVIHGFFVPAFRIKQDVVPGTTIRTWFEATRPGTYDVLCTQLCGFGHYLMAGRVRVLAPDEYERWLAAETAAWNTTGGGAK